VLNPQGYAIITDPDAPTRECDTITCCHCQRIVFVRPGQSASDAGGFCRLCMQPTCGPCADTGACTPFEKKLEEMERRGQLFRSLGI
jgi:hypothetical protein